MTYNTIRRPDVIEWTPPAEHSSGFAAAEAVTLWTDENGLGRYTNEQLPALEDKS